MKFYHDTPGVASTDIAVLMSSLDTIIHSVVSFPSWPASCRRHPLTCTDVRTHGAIYREVGSQLCVMDTNQTC